MFLPELVKKFFLTIFFLSESVLVLAHTFAAYQLLLILEYRTHFTTRTIFPE